MAPFHLEIRAGGVPAGATMPSHSLRLNAGTPASASVGTPGRASMPPSRVTASARNLPDCASGTATEAVANMVCT